MKSFAGKLSVVSGGGSGMGRALVVQLAREGSSVAFCDMSAESIAETEKLAMQTAAPGVKVTGHYCDVSKEADWEKFRDEVLRSHSAKYVNCLFNNAGIGGGGSLFTNTREEWERCYGVCWNGVYFGTLTFLKLIAASPEGHIVNTSSAAAFWASASPTISHTAYSTAKAAVRGFSESLLTDCRINAPHVGVSLVMPGHIGTKISENTVLVQGKRLGRLGKALSKSFEENAPLTAAQAADIILSGVKQNKWRILVGEDSVELDRMVRENPDEIYEVSFYEKMKEKGIFGGAGGPPKKEDSKL